MRFFAWFFAVIDASLTWYAFYELGEPYKVFAIVIGILVFSTHSLVGYRVTHRRLTDIFNAVVLFYAFDTVTNVFGLGQWEFPYLADKSLWMGALALILTINVGFLIAHASPFFFYLNAFRK